VKDEGANLNAMKSTLKSMMNCELFGLEDSFQGICFGHAFFQIMLIWDNRKKVCKFFKYVSIKLFSLVYKNA
jgi:hypothetical protein